MKNSGQQRKPPLPPPLPLTGEGNPFYKTTATSWGRMVLLSLFVGGLSLSARAETSFGEAGDYLRYGAGARSLGMGGAFTAVADDVSADYWNPAALAFLEEYQFQTMYAPFGMGSDLYYMAFGAPMGTRLGTLGVSALSLQSDGFQGRDELNFVSGGSGDIAHNAFSLSYGRSFMDLWSAGARLRFLQQKILSESGSAVGVDLSAYSRPWNGISAGATFNNLNKPSITIGNEADEFRPHTRLGLAYRAPRDLFILSMDANRTEQQSPYFVAGLEYNPIPLLSLRTGWDQNKDVTAGVGVTLRNLRFDYAFVNQEALGATNQVSLTFRWGNIYRAKITPVGLAENSDSIYIEGLQNEVRFAVEVPKLKIAHWTLIVSDEDGNVVRSLSEQYHPGSSLLWNMTDENGRPVKRGLYRYRFAVEYKSGKVWEERGKFRLDYKTNIVPDVELRMRVPGGLEGAEHAPQFAPITPPVPAPEAVPTTDSDGPLTPN